METPPALVVASVSGHPTAGFDLHDAEAAAASLSTSTLLTSKHSALEQLAAIKRLLDQEPEGSKERPALLDLHSQQVRELQAQLEREGLSHGSLVVKEGLQRLKGDIVTESDPYAPADSVTVTCNRNQAPVRGDT